MPVITVRNVPDAVYREIQKEAQVEKRSLNSQCLFIFEEHLKLKKPTEQILKEIDDLHARVGHSINYTPDQVKALIEEGRP